METMKQLLAALCFVCFSTAALAAPAFSTNVSTPIGRSDTTIIGQKNKVPKNPTVIFSSTEFAPGARTPVHKHPYPHYAYVEGGTLTIVQTDTGKSFDIKAGTFFLEMVNAWHYGINKGTTPIRVLVTDLVPAGVKTNSVMKDAKEVEGRAH
jgi:quercetin dioxygenase-like cupin family protein